MIKNLIGNARGCGCLVFLIILAIAFVAWQIEAQTVTTAYIQQMTMPDLILKRGAGIAWCVGCPEIASQLGATYYYGCCNTCPPVNDDRVAVIRPNWEWSSDCPADYPGYIIAGNEQEFSSLTPGQMAAWLIDLRAEYPEAVLVCLNSYDLEYAADVLAQLPPGICDILGVHIYDNVNVASHLDGLCDDCRFWISEIGQCSSNRDAAENLYRMVQEARVYGVEAIFFYTAVGGVNPCLNGIDGNGELTAVGQAWLNAVTNEVQYP